MQHWVCCLSALWLYVHAPCKHFGALVTCDKLMVAFINGTELEEATASDKKKALPTI